MDNFSNILQGCLINPGASELNKMIGVKSTCTITKTKQSIKQVHNFWDVLNLRALSAVFGDIVLFH